MHQMTRRLLDGQKDASKFQVRLFQGCCRISSRFFQRTPADVAAELHTVEMDLIGNLISLLLRNLDAVAQTDHTQYATAGGAQHIVVQCGAGMESPAVGGLDRKSTRLNSSH